MGKSANTEKRVKEVAAMFIPVRSINRDKGRRRDDTKSLDLLKTVLKNKENSTKRTEIKREGKGGRRKRLGSRSVASGTQE